MQRAIRSGSWSDIRGEREKERKRDRMGRKHVFSSCHRDGRIPDLTDLYAEYLTVAGFTFAGGY